MSRRNRRLVLCLWGVVASLAACGTVTSQSVGRVRIVEVTWGWCCSAEHFRHLEDRSGKTLLKGVGLYAVSRDQRWMLATIKIRPDDPHCYTYRPKVCVIDLSSGTLHSERDLPGSPSLGLESDWSPDGRFHLIACHGAEGAGSILVAECLADDVRLKEAYTEPGRSIVVPRNAWAADGGSLALISGATGQNGWASPVEVVWVPLDGRPAEKTDRRPAVNGTLPTTTVVWTDGRPAFEK